MTAPKETYKIGDTVALNTGETIQEDSGAIILNEYHIKGYVCKTEAGSIFLHTKILNPSLTCLPFYKGTNYWPLSTRGLHKEKQYYIPTRMVLTEKTITIIK